MNARSNLIAFVLDGKKVEIDLETAHNWGPTTTLLNYLRSLPNHKGTKEGCAEGDCGACTVALAAPNADGKMQYRAVDSCLIFLPMLHGKQLITVENLGTSSDLHPVQQAMVDTDGSQCGYCTPGFIMSMFGLFKTEQNPDRATIMDALTGNLCRCTGYRPILEAAAKSCSGSCADRFSEKEPAVKALLQEIDAQNTDLEIHAKDTTYLRPASLPAALNLREQHPDALIVCGGTDVGLMVTKRKLQLPKLLDLSGVKELSVIGETPQGLKIGATASLERVKSVAQNRFPALYDMLAVFGSKQIREQGTLGGNLANASPIGDMPPVLMALEADVEIQSASGSRLEKVSDFITGYRSTSLQKNELITAVIIPATPPSRIVKSYKISKRKDLDISTVSGGFWIVLDTQHHVQDIGLVFGGMAAMTKRAKLAEDFLRGKLWSQSNAEAAMELVEAEFSPISDARSGKEGRRIMARNLLLKFWADTRISQPA